MRVCRLTLHLQIRAKLHERQSGRVKADKVNNITRSVVDTQTSLFAMSSYSLQYIIPRMQSLVMQTAAVGATFARIADAKPAEMPMKLTRLAAELDRCCMILRGGARSSPRGAGVMRMNEQRLWGALAAELHVIEGSDGSIMRACSNVELLAFEVSTAIQHLFEENTDMPMTVRRDLGIALICLKVRAGSDVLSDAELAKLLQLFNRDLPQIVPLIQNLVAGYRTLCAASRQISMALSIALQASAQSAATARLEAAMQDLDRHLGEAANEYRAMAQMVKCPMDQHAITERTARAEAHWQLAAAALAEPMALSNEMPKVPDFLSGIARRNNWLGWDQRG